MSGTNECLYKRKESVKSKQICHIEFIEMRTNLFANHCYISTKLNMTMIGVFETTSYKCPGLKLIGLCSNSFNPELKHTGWRLYLCCFANFFS